MENVSESPAMGRFAAALVVVLLVAAMSVAVAAGGKSGGFVDDSVPQIVKINGP